MMHRSESVLHLRPPRDRRHFLSVPRDWFQAFSGLPVAARDATLARALDLVRGRSRVLVCDARCRLLHPCHPARARALIRRGQGRLVSLQPPVLQLVRTVEERPLDPEARRS